MSENQLNPEHVINSLTNRSANTYADLILELAQKDTVIIKERQEKEELKKDNENLKEQLAKKEKNNNKGSNAKKK